MRLITIILMSVVLMGCNNDSLRKDVRNTKPIIHFDDELILNPNADVKIIFVSGKILNDPGLEGLYDPYEKKMWVDVRRHGNKHANVAVTLHEVTHHLEFLAKENDWTHDERVRLGKLIVECLREVNDEENEFEVVSHESWLHFYTPANSLERQWARHYRRIIDYNDGDEDMKLLTPQEVEEVRYHDWLERQEGSSIEE